MKRIFSAGVLSLVIITLFALCITGSSFTSAAAEGDEAQALNYADKYIDLHLHLDGAVTVEIA